MPSASKVAELNSASQPTASTRARRRRPAPAPRPAARSPRGSALPRARPYIEPAGDGQGGDRRSRRPGARCASRARARSTSPSPGYTKRDLAEYYVAVADAACLHLRERPTTMKRFVDGAAGEFFFQKRVPKTRPRLARDGDGQVPERPQRDRALRQRRRAPRLGGQPRGDRLQPVAGAARRPRPSRRAAGRPRPDPGVELRRGPPGGARASARCSPTTACAAIPKTSGSRGIHVNVRIEPKWDFTEVRRAALALAREVERRIEAGDLEVVEGGAPRRLRRLQPERPRPHRRLAPGRCARRPTPASRPRSSGTRSPDVDPAELRLDTVPGAARRARRPLGDDRRRPPLARLAARARRPRRGRGPRRRALAAALPQAEGRAEARAAEPGEEETERSRSARPTAADWEQIWPFFREIVAAGETYAYDPEMTEARCARALDGRSRPASTFVAVDDGSVVGTANAYANRAGPGSHVASASFMVDPARAGRGIGRALGERVIEWATRRGLSRRCSSTRWSRPTPARSRSGARSASSSSARSREAFRLPDGSLTGLHVMYRPLEPR